MPPPPNRPNIPQDPRERQNRELAARRLAEQQAAINESRLMNNPQVSQEDESFSNPAPRMDLPPGFVMPPTPNVGDYTEGRYPQGKMPIMPPPEAMIHQQQQQFAQDEAERLQALYEAGVISQPPPQQQMPPPPSQQRAAPVAAQHQNSQANRSKPAPRPEEVHPILKQLRFDLGLDHQKTIDLTVADHVWSFYPLTPELTTLALRIAEIGGTAETERTLLQQYAAVCCSIVAIDNTPIWQVFGITPEKDDDVSVPVLPKGRIRQRAALALLQELMMNSKLGLISALLEAYNAEVDPTSSVKGYTAYKNEKYFKFICPIADCEFSLVRSKRFSSDNKVLPYHCELHGSEMYIEDENGVNDVRGGLNPLA